MLKNYDLDILLLAECQRPEHEFLREVRSQTSQPFREASVLGGSKVRFFYNSDNCSVSDCWDSLMGDMSAKRVQQGDVSILLFGVHFPSVLGSSKEAQSQWAVEAVSEVRRIETENNHSNSIVIGDFNICLLYTSPSPRDS